MALLDHPGDDGLGADEGGVQVHVDDGTEVRRAHFDHGDALDDAGVVDQDVDGADFFLDLLDEGLHSGLVGHVAGVAVGLDALGGVSVDAHLGLFRVQVVENDGRAGGGEGFRDRKADAVGSAGDPGYFAFQAESVHVHGMHPPFLFGD